MNVEYKAGKFLFLSDCLSRMSNLATREEDESRNLQVMSIVDNHDEEHEHCISLTTVKQVL